VAFLQYDALLELVEEFIVAVVSRVLERCAEPLAFLERDTAALERVVPPFPRLSYDEAAAQLSTAAARAEMEAAGAPAFRPGGDFGSFDETLLTRAHDRPLFVTHWPAAIKAFYMQPNPADPTQALAVDLLAPEGYGEIVGGSERIHDHDLLLARIREHGLPEAAFGWYLDIRKYGTVPHAGFGMGIERFVAWICGIPHLREAIPYPRQIHRNQPGLRQEPARLRGDARPPAAGRLGIRDRSRRSRRDRRQHLRVHRACARGIDPDDPRGRRIQEEGAVAPARGRGLHGAALRRRAAA
jgi:asparaginyl-tRNA synthetase